MSSSRAVNWSVVRNFSSAAGEPSVRAALPAFVTAFPLVAITVAVATRRSSTWADLKPPARNAEMAESPSLSAPVASRRVPLPTTARLRRLLQ
ncbi:hypothetical protein OHA61_04825 [Streptomyces sp. NBC_00885]|nr:hypothetical protein OHA61_04825 [Streptomyces sp. NBC_00885]